MVTSVLCLGKICCLRRSQKCGQSGQGQNGQNRKRIVKILHYNINILFIYSEQMTEFPKSILTKMTMTKMTTMFGKNLEVTK